MLYLIPSTKNSNSNSHLHSDCSKDLHEDPRKLLQRNKGKILTVEKNFLLASRFENERMKTKIKLMKWSVRLQMGKQALSDSNLFEWWKINEKIYHIELLCPF